MPAILRIFLYQTDASQSVIGSTTSYDQIVGHRGSRSQRHEGLQHYALGSVGVALLPFQCVPEVLGIAQQCHYGDVE